MVDHPFTAQEGIISFDTTERRDDPFMAQEGINFDPPLTTTLTNMFSTPPGSIPTVVLSTSPLPTDGRLFSMSDHPFMAQEGIISFDTTERRDDPFMAQEGINFDPPPTTTLTNMFPTPDGVHPNALPNSPFPPASVPSPPQPKPKKQWPASLIELCPQVVLLGTPPDTPILDDSSGSPSQPFNSQYPWLEMMDDSSSVDSQATVVIK